VDPGSTSAGHAGWSTGSKTLPDHLSLAPAADGDHPGEALRRRRRRAEDVGRNGSSPSSRSDARRGRGTPEEGELAAASADTCGETATGGGDSVHLGPIPSRGRKRAARQSCSAGRGSRGRRGTAAEGDGRSARVR
jgi:hypothetical protein